MIEVAAFVLVITTFFLTEYNQNFLNESHPALEGFFFRNPGDMDES